MAFTNDRILAAAYEGEDLITRVRRGPGFTFVNGGDMEFWGLELEGKYFIRDAFFLLGSLTYQNSRQDEDLRESVVPHVMLKLGASYRWRALRLACFYDFYSDPGSISEAAQVNPDPEAAHLLSAKLEWDASHWLSLASDRIVLQLQGENLADQAVHHPEFNRRNINSLPRLPGVAFYGGVRAHF